jgi:hypothetical protein
MGEIRTDSLLDNQSLFMFLSPFWKKHFEYHRLKRVFRATLSIDVVGRFVFWHNDSRLNAAWNSPNAARIGLSTEPTWSAIACRKARSPAPDIPIAAFMNANRTSLRRIVHAIPFHAQTHPIYLRISPTKISQKKAK